MKESTRAGLSCVIALMALSLTAGRGAAASETLFVTNDGIDAGNCGSRPKPCRSIRMSGP